MQKNLENFVNNIKRAAARTEKRGGRGTRG